MRVIHRRQVSKHSWRAETPEVKPETHEVALRRQIPSKGRTYRPRHAGDTMLPEHRRNLDPKAAFPKALKLSMRKSLASWQTHDGAQP